MISSAKKQKGLTFITIVFILGLIAFFVLLALKIVPIYLNHSKVVNALTAVQNLENVEHMSKHEIRGTLNKRFGMNYVEKVEKENVSITKRTNYIKVEIEYEQVEKLFGNLSVLVEFYDFFEAGEEE